MGDGLKRAFAAAKATRVKPESKLPITKLSAGRYRVREGELQFDINKLQTGWDLVGYGDAAYKILQLRGVQGYFMTLTSAQRRLTGILMHPATQLLQKTLRVPEGEKAEFDIRGLDPQDVQDVAGILNFYHYSTHISAEKIEVQR